MEQLKQEWNSIKTKYESSKFISNSFVQNFEKKGEIIYLIAIALVVFEKGLLTTMLREISEFSPILAWTDLAVVTLLWIKMLIGYAKNLNKFMGAMCVLLASQTIAGLVEDQYIMLLTLFILCAYEVSFEKITKVYIASIATLMTAAFTATMLGYITHIKYYVWGRGFRYSLGGVYPTDTMAHVFFIMMACLFLARRTMKLWKILLLGIISYVLFYFTNSKTGWYCILLALIGCTLVYVVQNYSKTNDIAESKILNVVKYLLIWSMPIGAACFTVIVRIYMYWHRLRTYFPHTIGSRMGMTAKAFREYGVPLWGCPIQMHGNGGKLTPVADYFFIDCSYMWVLFVYGIIVLFIVLGLFIALGYKYKKDWYMLVILFAIALDCTIEHHLTDISYNIFLVALLASNTPIAIKNWQKEELR